MEHSSSSSTSSLASSIFSSATPELSRIMDFASSMMRPSRIPRPVTSANAASSRPRAPPHTPYDASQQIDLGLCVKLYGVVLATITNWNNDRIGKLQEKLAEAEKNSKAIQQVWDKDKEVWNTTLLGKNAEIAEMREGVMELMRKLAAETEAKGNLQGKLKEEREWREDAEARAVKGAETCYYLKEQNFDLNERLENAESEKKKAEENLEKVRAESKKRLTDAEKQLQDAQEISNNLYDGIECLTNERDDLETTLEQQEARCAALEAGQMELEAQHEKELQNAKEVNRNLHDGIQNLEEQCGVIQKALGLQEDRCGALEAGKNKLETQHASFKEESRRQNNDLAQQCNNLQDNVDCLRNNLHGMENRLTEKQAECEALEVALTQQKNRCHALEAEKVEIKRQHANLMEESRHQNDDLTKQCNALQNDVDDLRDHLLDVMNHLKQEQAGRQALEEAYVNSELERLSNEREAQGAAATMAVTAVNGRPRTTPRGAGRWAVTRQNRQQALKIVVKDDGMWRDPRWKKNVVDVSSISRLLSAVQPERKVRSACWTRRSRSPRLFWS
ncbi:hypothetical protein AJ80_02136 [Polytolypa hystricis UAMH7299]|uniref:Uncharacterized protein n=1 Tax=Polytolypa hystricis (strain UAMH7299) TaxID=1447883 RepID=A0A2B7YTD0_POLH7|nr:hypothetical protein AJ80_02136 [Polytolypa hystricis UAMH7299]